MVVYWSIQLQQSFNLSKCRYSQPLDYSFNVKYLGLIIDCHLSWLDHIEYVCVCVRVFRPVIFYFDYCMLSFLFFCISILIELIN